MNESQTQFSDVTLAVLAGGEGRRMGKPKSELRIGGKPILALLLDRFAWPGPTMLVTAPGREHPPGGERFDVEAIDPVAGEGPLRGIHTALARATSRVVLVTTVDMPSIEHVQLTWLVEELRRHPGALGMMTQRTDAADADAIEPFPSIYSRDAIDTIAAQLAARRRAVHALARLDRFILAPAPGAWAASVWLNLNAPEDLFRIS